MAAPMTLTSGWLTLSLLMALLSTIAHLQPGVNAAAGVGDGGGVVMSVDGGRKMGLVVNRKETVAVASSSSTISSRVYNKGKKIFKAAPESLSCKKIGYESCSSSGKERGPDYEKEFAALDADYRAPRHHPPKNNK